MDIEGCAGLLLYELERGVAMGYSFPSKVILAMNDLKKALNQSDDELGKHLNLLEAQVNKKHLKLIKD